MPYFGQWPEWIHLYLASCARNPTIRWLFLTDCDPLGPAPPNTQFERMTWDTCARMIERVTGVGAPLATPYKLCDFRFSFGDVFRDYIDGYDFWGFGDIDVIYGDLRSFLTADRLNHDLITFNRTHVAGHFTLLRNTREMSVKYRQCENWRRAINDGAPQFLDEHNGFYGAESVFAEESYNTPLSPYIPWTTGEYAFPSAWYCRNGNLYTNLDGPRSFMYLHFMRYKYLWRDRGLSQVVHVPPHRANSDWILLADGFHPIEPGETTRLSEQSLPPQP